MTQATTTLQFYFAAWHFFRYNDFSDSLFLCKAFYLDSTDIQIKILIVVDIVFQTTPQKYLHERNRLNKENKSFYFDIFVCSN